MPDNPNPQGKGQVPVLEHWQSLRPALVEVKDPRTLLTDYVVSLLVLSAQFSFKPVVGNRYYLYRAGSLWKLSLIAPGEWTSSSPGHYVGSCCLRGDMTWNMTPAEDLERHPGLVDDLRVFVRDFLAALGDHATLEAGLPYYVQGLPFYRRLLATGLASSVGHAARISGLAGRDSSFWLANLRAPSSGLADAPREAAQHLEQQVGC